MRSFLNSLEKEGQTGWLFGPHGSPTGRTKCCLVKNERELLIQLEQLPKNLSSTDKYLIIDTDLIESSSYAKVGNITKLLQKIAVKNNISVIAITEKAEELFEPIDGRKYRIGQRPQYRFH